MEKQGVIQSIELAITKVEDADDTPENCKAKWTSNSNTTDMMDMKVNPRY
jgi:hypothetical protein